VIRKDQFSDAGETENYSIGFGVKERSVPPLFGKKRTRRNRKVREALWRRSTGIIGQQKKNGTSPSSQKGECKKNSLGPKNPHDGGNNPGNGTDLPMSPRKIVGKKNPANTPRRRRAVSGTRTREKEDTPVKKTGGTKSCNWPKLFRRAAKERRVRVLQTHRTFKS